MKLAALCCTYHRPHLLGELIESFRRQDYPIGQRELIVLDDAGQYANQEGDGWRIVSLPRRFRTLGEKRNACAALASPDVEGFLVADDDDIYLPHWFSTQAAALNRAEWSRPSLVLLQRRHGLTEHETGGLYHGGWAFRRAAFDLVRGYGPHNNGEDQELAGRLNEAGVTEIDPCGFAQPFYIYREHNNSYHVSYLNDEAYRSLGSDRVDRAGVSAAWSQQFDQLPIIRRYRFGTTTVADDSGALPVELIGPVSASPRGGPSGGMHALQKFLRQRLEAGHDWLSIKPLPASRGALAWFWQGNHRRYAAWWDSQGQPFVQGPNLVVPHTDNGHVDHEETALVTTANCRAIFCHSAWRRDSLAEHRGTINSPIEVWPYPIDPWPGGPLPDAYDVLIYGKNGNRPQLLEHLAKLFPRNIQIHHGGYQREELFEAARRSRACAFLADGEDGPLALQEILLAGCPAIGVKSGASLVEPGRTGQFVDRLPPGLQCVETADDEAALAKYLEVLSQVQDMDRSAVRTSAAECFDTNRIVEHVIAALDRARRSGANNFAARGRDSTQWERDHAVA